MQTPMTHGAYSRLSRLLKCKHRTTIDSHKSSVVYVATSTYYVAHRKSYMLSEYSHNVMPLGAFTFFY